MLTLLLPLLAALATPVPEPLATGAPSPLKEIGRVQALSVCSAVVVHANAAIGATLDNDAQLALVVNRLRTTDLDTANEIARRNGMNDLFTLAGRIRTGAATGTGEVKRLRAMAAETTEPARKAELKAFTDALAGALARQRKAGLDLDHLLVIIDGRRAVDEVNGTSAQDRAAISDPGIAGHAGLGMNSGEMRTSLGFPGGQPVDPMLRDVADDFTARSQAILADEGVAADHALGAATGC